MCCSVVLATCACVACSENKCCVYIRNFLMFLVCLSHAAAGFALVVFGVVFDVQQGNSVFQMAHGVLALGVYTSFVTTFGIRSGCSKRAKCARVLFCVSMFLLAAANAALVVALFLWPETIYEFVEELSDGVHDIEVALDWIEGHTLIFQIALAAVSGLELLSVVSSCCHCPKGEQLEGELHLSRDGINVPRPEFHPYHALSEDNPAASIMAGRRPFLDHYQPIAATAPSAPILPAVAEAARMENKHLEVPGSVGSQHNYCKYAQLCREYIHKNLRIDAGYFDGQGDKCFCRACYTGSEYMNRKNTGLYALPTGWYRRGLGLAHNAKVHQVLDRWHIAYHGTRAENLKSILAGNQLLLPGQVAFDGEEIRIRSSHIADGFERQTPEGSAEMFDPNQIFMSPSIRYCDSQIYSSTQTWTRQEGAGEPELYNVQVALAVRVQPGCYSVGPETIGARRRNEQIDPQISNGCIEWYTKNTTSVIITGLLVKINTLSGGQDWAWCQQMYGSQTSNVA